MDSASGRDDILNKLRAFIRFYYQLIRYVTLIGRQVWNIVDAAVTVRLVVTVFERKPDKIE